MKPGKRVPVNFLMFFAVVALTFAAGQILAAQSRSASTNPQQVSVVGHLDLQGMEVKHIVPQKRGNKSYLFLRRVDKNTFAIVDVTNPVKPVLVDWSVLQEPSGSSVDLPPSGSSLAIAFVPDPDEGSAVKPEGNHVVTLRTESVRLIDLADPQHPKTVKTFDRVTSVATDDGRKLIFLANNEGLWIVSHHRQSPLPMCTSEAAIEPVANCQ